MPVQLRWLDDEKRILIFDFIGRWTTQEMIAAAEEERRLCIEIGTPLAYINDFSQSTRIPLDIVLHIGKFVNDMQPFIPTYMMNCDTSVRFLLETALRFFPGMPFYFVSSVEEVKQRVQAQVAVAVNDEHRK